ncbi:nudC domain-containing protein 3 [Maniola hyperantus]|uniref:nudC domain-containing protein 3 n=1 Tax=Aphantopus hyperantus TaxID=2795564 RepID=UPI001568ED33|nr:nudC domain-containing protein 3 [Maniola hyperantus]
MADSAEYTKYDDVLTSILVNEKSILGFLSTIFNFLARRTDFYHVPVDSEYKNMGFPPGVAEELVLKVLRRCDPKNWHTNTDISTDMNEIMCSTVAQEVEVVADDNMDEINETLQDIEIGDSNNSAQSKQDARTYQSSKVNDKTMFPEDYEPPVIPTQKNSESYNGAIKEKYSWAQTIMDLDITMKLPPVIKSAKELKVTINPGDICIACRNGDIIIKDTLAYKVKTRDSFWSISEGRLLIHLEKVQERWWNKLLSGEEEIDISKIDCSRPLNELPEDHILKIHELQWNQEQKMKGLPTSDEIRNIETLKKAWNAPGSPFQGKEFNPNVLIKK